MPTKTRKKKWVQKTHMTNPLQDRWDIPVEVRSESNLREHWSVRMTRAQEQKSAVFACVRSYDVVRWRDLLPVRGIRITFTRLGGRKMDRSNLPVAFKAIEDALAKVMQVDDGHANWLPHYEQSPGGPVGVRISIEEA